MFLSIGVARFDLVLDAVEAGHEHGREGEVGVAGRVGAAELDPLGLRAVAVHRNPATGRSIAQGPGKVDRGLVAGHQAAVTVGGRRGEGEDRRRVREQPADVPFAHLRQAGIAGRIGEQRLAGLPDRLVAMHARAVVAVERLGHERRGLAVLGRHVPDDVLVLHLVVGHRQQRVELHVDLGLTRGRDLMVLALDREPDLDHGQRHLGAQVLQRVIGRAGEVAFLRPDLVAEVGALVPIGVPVPFPRVRPSSWNIAGRCRTGRCRR